MQITRSGLRARAPQAPQPMNLDDGAHYPPVVHVFGLFKSNTNNMCEYLRRYFHCDVEPTPKHPGRVRYWD
eukprot:9942695-Prorocentrum_lima.AAC.1